MQYLMIVSQFFLMGKKYKVGCIFPMVILSELRKGKYTDDHRENAPHVIFGPRISTNEGCLFSIVTASILLHTEFGPTNWLKPRKWTRHQNNSILKWGASSWWSSSLYYSIRISDQMTIGKRHSTLLVKGYKLLAWNNFSLWLLSKCTNS